MHTPSAPSAATTDLSFLWPANLHSFSWLECALLLQSARIHQRHVYQLQLWAARLVMRLTHGCNLSTSDVGRVSTERLPASNVICLFHMVPSLRSPKGLGLSLCTLTVLQVTLWCAASLSRCRVLLLRVWLYSSDSAGLVLLSSMPTHKLHGAAGCECYGTCVYYCRC